MSVAVSAWRWSANRAPASPRCRVRSVASTVSGPATSCSTVSHCDRRHATDRPPSASRSSTSSRTRTARCTRGGASGSRWRGRCGSPVPGETKPAGAVDEMLERVSLTSAYAAFYPDQLSGGERRARCHRASAREQAIGAHLRRGHLGARRARASGRRRAPASSSSTISAWRCSSSLTTFLSCARWRSVSP